jgi:DNA polymerase-3 subunit delta
MSVNCKLLFVYGGDDFLVDRRARVLYDTHCADGEIFSYDPKVDVSQFILSLCETLSTVPMFTSTNNVWVRGVRFLAGTESEETRAKIIPLVGTIKHLDGGVVLISASPVDRRTKLFKELSQLAECYDVTDISDKTFNEFIVATCKENGVKITADASALLRNLVGMNCRLAQLEIEKLASYICGDRGTITVEDVNLLVDASDGGEFFQQIEIFYSTDVEEKMSSIERYFYYTGDARPLIVGLQNRTRLLIQLRALIDSNKIQIGRSLSKVQLENIANILNINILEKNSYNVFSQNPWYLSKILAHAGRYSMEHLFDIQLALMDTIGSLARNYDDQVSAMRKLALKF